MLCFQKTTLYWIQIFNRDSVSNKLLARILCWHDWPWYGWSVCMCPLGWHSEIALPWNGLNHTCLMMDDKQSGRASTSLSRLCLGMVCHRDLYSDQFFFLSILSHWVTSWWRMTLIIIYMLMIPNSTSLSMCLKSILFWTDKVIVLLIYLNG